MFEVGQQVVGITTALRCGASHPSVEVGRVYTVRKIMADGRVIVDGIEWGLSPERFSASVAADTL